MSVEMLPSQERVEITSARVFGGRDDRVGEWCHIIDYYDFDGNCDPESDYVSLPAAKRKARQLAAHYGCPIIDMSSAAEDAT